MSCRTHFYCTDYFLLNPVQRKAGARGPGWVGADFQDGSHGGAVERGAVHQQVLVRARRRLFVPCLQKQAHSVSQLEAHVRPFPPSFLHSSLRSFLGFPSFVPSFLSPFLNVLLLAFLKTPSFLPSFLPLFLSPLRYSFCPSFLPGTSSRTPWARTTKPS